MKRNASVELMVLVAVVVAMFLLVFVPIVATRSSESEVLVSVIKTENTRKDAYLVFSDKETFTVEDSLSFWRWNSSDVYGGIQPGRTYRMRVCGWRVPFLSMYRNILKAEEIR